MYVHALRIRNFRRLKDVLIDLSSDISIFVGANNSGKTSTSQAVQLFMSATRDKFSIHDFNSECWAEINDFGDQREGAKLPKISIDFWFHVEEADLHRVVDLLPSLNWQGSQVGMRIEFAPLDEAVLLGNFITAREKVIANMQGQKVGTDYQPSPKSLCEYLNDNLGHEFELRYYVLDRAHFDDSLLELPDYIPLLFTPDKGRSGKDILNSLLHVDYVGAQRYLSDNLGGSQMENLSHCLSRFYKRNLEKRGDDYNAIQALEKSEDMLDKHLARVFEPTLQQLAKLGYPGLGNPKLVIKSALNPASLMCSYDSARVFYSLGDSQDGDDSPTLPERYNGLGFKNLIYMVVELLNLHAQWMEIEENRPPLHLIFIEEPEAHLHAQLQQVFIREVLNILVIDGDDTNYYKSQLVVTTHSAHILYERGFRPIRYFRRCIGTNQSSEVLNLSVFYDNTAKQTRDFLERYLKLTHCDLFFADAAILVEGNVERLLIPQMIEKVAEPLKSTYLTILEIGGAFGYRFRSLIEFLGITALIVTDIDSVIGPGPTNGGLKEAAASAESIEEQEETDETEDEEDGEDNNAKKATACMAHIPDAVTTNQTLIQWLPAKNKIADLLQASPEERTQRRTDKCQALIRVVYQTPIEVTWRDEKKILTGRTLEEAFAFENLAWCQHKDRKNLNLRFARNDRLTLDLLTEKIHKRIKSTSFKKTDFALALLMQDPKEWSVPTYISQGLQWLKDEIAPLPQQEQEAIEEVVE